MPLIVTRSQRTRQPQVAVGVAKTPLTRGLLVASVCGGQNAVNGGRPIYSWPTAISASRAGLMLATDVNGYAQVPCEPGAATGYTLLTVSAFNAAWGRRLMLMLGDEQAPNYDQVALSSGSDSSGSSAPGGIAFWAYSSSFRYQIATTGINDNLPHVVVGVADTPGSRCELWIDGSIVASTGTVGSQPGGLTPIAQLSGSSAASRGGPETALSLVWARALSADEIRRVSANPWQVLAFVKRRIWAPDASGSTVPDITFVGAENILATSADYRVTLDYA